MKFKSLALLAVTVAGTAMLAAACQSPTPQAQDTASPAQAQNTEAPDNAPSRASSNGYSQGDRLPSSLKLTDEQKNKLKEIRKNYRSKMEGILTDEQKNELKTARQQGKRTSMQSLNLTDTQKQQMKDLRQSQRQETDSVLTAEQKQQLQETRQQRQKGQGSQGE